MEQGVFTVLFSKSLEKLELMGKSAFNKAKSWRGARDEMKKLEKTIKMIQARVHDAETRQEEETSALIKEWLRRLKLVLYRADDLFDEVLTLDRHHKQRTEQSMVAKVALLLSKSGPLLYNIKLAHKIKSIRKELDVIKSDMDGLNLKVLVVEELQLPIDRLMKNRETASLVKAEDVIGRENDKNMIIEMLFDPKYDEKKLTVIPIVGFGGLGKTTLAQYIFNDESVQKHFDLFFWVCNPEVDNHRAVMEKIYKSFTDEDSSDCSLNQMKLRIQKVIKDQKYLLVLDDIWDESRHRWLDLATLLECGGFGSKIIVTTRSNVVADIVGTIPEAYKLGFLSDDESWNLFKRLALKSGQDESNPNFTQIGKEIVHGCGNVPLAIRVVGSLLYSKDSVNEWKFFKEEKLSKAKLIKDGNIMPVLKLSYDYLAPGLKQCFAYCSLFPKDYEFNKANLVHLWMAQGYLEPSDEDTGDRYFMELLGRNFFQNPEEDEEGDVNKCKMHDLVHDLAQHIASDESMTLGESETGKTEELIHVSVNLPHSDTREKDDKWEAPRSLLDSRKLRSLLFRRKYDDRHGIKASSLVKLVSKFKSLRALELREMKIIMVPDSIEGLRHLRYLNLEGNDMECLPGALTRLHNLQTLNLDRCKNLKELPRDFPKLNNLRHLVVYWGSLTDLPSGFGKMTSLHELHTFEVGNGKNTGIDSLPALNLRGKLEIQFHKWHRNAIIEAQRASLKDNQELAFLVVKFLFEVEDTPSFGDMDLMLNCLQLPLNMKNLKVDGYIGNEMPRKWLDGFSELVSIRIEKCKNSKILPHFSGLPNLKSLYLVDMESLEYIEDVEDIVVGGGDRMSSFVTHNLYFPSLEVLELVDLPQLKGWWTGQSKDDGEKKHLLFPHLLKMKFNGCRQLVSMPLAPKLVSFEATRISGELLKSNVTSFDDQKAPLSSLCTSPLLTTLKQLQIYQIHDSLEHLSFSSRLCKLSRLEISHCYQLKSLMFESPNSIQHLVISWCKSLKNICKGLQNLSNLEELEIRNCEKLEEDEEEENEENAKTNNSWQAMKSLRSLKLSYNPKFKKLPQGLTHLTTLERLSISNLENLAALPDEIDNLSLLQELWISNCPKLVSLPPSIEGLISLQKLQIRKCSDLGQRYKKTNQEDFQLIQHIPQVIIED